MTTTGADTHIVLLRRFSDDPSRDGEPRWEGVGFAPSLRAAQDLALRHPGTSAGLGDLLLALPMEGVNPLLMRAAAKNLYVGRVDGSVVGPIALHSELSQSGGRGATWLTTWEGPRASAFHMLKSAAEVDMRRLVMVAVDIAMSVRHYISPSENRSDAAINAALAWVRGRSKSEDLRPVWDATNGLVHECRQHVNALSVRAQNTGLTDEDASAQSVLHAALAALHAVQLPMARAPGVLASSVASDAAYAVSGGGILDGYDDALFAMAEIVRRHIPLSVEVLTFSRPR